MANEVALPNEDAFNLLPKALREKVEISPEGGTLTIKGGATAEQVRKVAETFKSADAARQVKEQLDTAQALQAAPAERVKTPAELGVKASVPLLSYEQSGFFDVFDGGLGLGCFVVHQRAFARFLCLLFALHWQLVGSDAV